MTVDGAREAGRRLAKQLAHGVDQAQWPMLAREFVEGPDKAARLQGLLEGTWRGHTRDAWLAFAIAACGGDLSYDLTAELYAAAVAADLELVKLVLLGGEQPHRTAKAADFQPDDLIGHLTLGRKKALARRPDPNMLDRLTFDGDASVVRILLDNPRVTEPLVVRLAARRPNRVATLSEIAASPRWLCRREVQRSLVFNPYTPARIATVLVPLLQPSDQRTISRDGGLHPLLRRLSGALLAARKLGMAAFDTDEPAPATE